jgi:hypothetical protein
MRLRVVAGVAAGVALAVSGCGGSSSLNRTQLVQRADAICSRIDKQVVASIRSVGVGGQGRRGSLSQVYAAAQPHWTQGLRDLDALTPSGDVRPAYDQMVSMMRARWTTTAEASKQEERFGETDPRRKAKQRREQEIDRIDHRIGLRTCH